MNKVLKKVDPNIIKEYINSNPTHSIKKIASGTGYSAPTIRKYIKEYNMQYNYDNDTVIYEDIININDLSKYISDNPDLTLDKIAKHFYVSKSFIGNTIKRNNIPYKSKRVDKMFDDNEIINFMIKYPEATASKIAKHFNANVSTINNYIRRINKSRKII
ncbi:hypothetical protein FPHOBKDP_00067 [Listeria phage LPJP1]|nr:hypothetical protein FPHOBKDP_00067 [Listeria phage LPJP1]